MKSQTCFIRFAAAALILFTGTQAIVAVETEKPIIKVYRYAPTEDSGLDALTSTMMNQISFSLRLVGRYEILLSDTTAQESFFDRELKSNLESFQADGIDAVVIGGAVVKEKKIFIEVAALDTHQGIVTIQKSTEILSVFEIFDLADTMEKLLLEGITKEHIGYGSLKIVRTGPGKRSYEVYIDGNRLGTDITDIPRLMAGKRRIELVFPEGANIADSTIIIPENGAAEMRFFQPALTPEEERALSALHGKVRKEGLLDSRPPYHTELKSTVAEARNYTERIIDPQAKKDILRVLDGWEDITGETAFPVPAAAIDVDGKPEELKADKRKTALRERAENLEIYTGLSKKEK